MHSGESPFKQWARQKKSAEIQELKKAQPQNFVLRLSEVVQSLAWDKETDAVLFLINEFEADIYLGLSSFAQSGKHHALTQYYWGIWRGLCRNRDDHKDRKGLTQIYEAIANGYAEGGYLSGSFAKILRLASVVDFSVKFDDVTMTLISHLSSKMKEINSHPSFSISMWPIQYLQGHVLDVYRKRYQHVLVEFLQTDGDPNWQIADSYKSSWYSLLHCAAYEGDEKNVQVLLEYSADTLPDLIDKLSIYDVAASARIQALMLCLSSNISRADKVRPEPQEPLVAKICRLAKAKASAALTEMAKQKISFSEHNANHESAIFLLARDKQIEAVNFLIQFPYCRGEIFSFDAISGYAAGGHVEELDKLLLCIGAVMRNYAENSAIYGFEKGGHLSGKRESVLRLMSLISDVKLRRRLAEKVKEKNDRLNVDVLMRDAATIVKYRKVFAGNLSSLLDQGLQLDKCMIEGLPLITCVIIAGDEDHLIEALAKREKVLGHYHCPREASIKLKALMLCLSRTISQEEVEYLKDHKEALFVAIKLLPENITDCALLSVVHNKGSPIHQVMYDDSHMPEKIRNEIKKRGLEVEPSTFIVDLNYELTFFKPGEEDIPDPRSTIDATDRDRPVGYRCERFM